MKMIFERDIEHSDYLEIILSRKEVEGIEKGGVVQDFENGITKKKPINVFIRLGKGEEQCL